MNSSSTYATNFPPLPSGSSGVPVAPLRDWNNIFAPSEVATDNIPLSFFPEEPEIVPFSGEKLLAGAQGWSLCLVGYSLGRRPYYETLLGAIKRTWSLKGSVKLLSLSDGFFLLRFTSSEDFDMVWNRGVWFLLGRPFVLQKWHPRFRPTRENFSNVPIWVKIHDLPLACWNSEGISRIASKVGIPLAVDSLTAQKTRLTYARVCVQVDCSAKYPDEIPISLDGDVFSLKVQYEWRPTPCEFCKSLVHPSSLCPSNPSPSTANPGKPSASARGRSTSRKPQNRTPRPSPAYTPSNPPPSSSFKPSASLPDIAIPVVGTQDAIATTINDPAPEQRPTPDPVNDNLTVLNSSEIIPKHNLETIAEVETLPVIPNLNSPNEDTASTSGSSFSLALQTSQSFHSPNKFSSLQDNLQDDALGEEDTGQFKTSHKQSPIYINTGKKPAKGKGRKPPNNPKH
ncbi:RNA exonuclease 1 [Dendrobium catenatum]|uniref:RNA exonuclease 1 n=1 Tax=Dendrobium catenatum TaxID=906689 RepID=A0A2I0WM15_9ASPA|nr:RNA exonuclease 1 [Dendrobium catenatum]